MLPIGTGEIIMRKWQIVEGNGYATPAWPKLKLLNTQQSLYFKTAHGALKMCSHIAGGLKIKV